MEEYEIKETVMKNTAPTYVLGVIVFISFFCSFSEGEACGCLCWWRKKERDRQEEELRLMRRSPSPSGRFLLLRRDVSTEEDLLQPLLPPIGIRDASPLASTTREWRFSAQ